MRSRWRTTSSAKLVCRMQSSSARSAWGLVSTTHLKPGWHQHISKEDVLVGIQAAHPGCWLKVQGSRDSPKLSTILELLTWQQC